MGLPIIGKAHFAAPRLLSHAPVLTREGLAKECRSWFLSGKFSLQTMRAQGASVDDLILEEFRVVAVEPKPPLKSRVVSSVYRVRRRIATGLAVVLAVFFGFHVMFGHNGLNAYEAKRAEDRSLQKQIESLKQENDRLKGHVDRLKSDPDAIEHEAREKLHYARPDEVIWTMNDAAHPADSPTNDASPSVQAKR
jgi:cell division protein FtsB